MNADQWEALPDDAQVTHGFLVRPGSEFGLSGHIRVTVGPPELMERAAEAIASVRTALFERGAVV